MGAGRSHVEFYGQAASGHRFRYCKPNRLSQSHVANRLPGNVNPKDRFQRAIYYSALLPKPKNDREAAASILAIARNVSVPFGAPYKGFNTEYRTAIDLKAKRYYFELTTSPNVIWGDLASLNLDPGQPVLSLDPDDIALSGDVGAKFKPIKAPF